MPVKKNLENMVIKKIAILSKDSKDYFAHILNRRDGITYVLVRELSDIYGMEFSGYEETGEAKNNPRYKELKEKITYLIR